MSTTALLAVGGSGLLPPVSMTEPSPSPRTGGRVRPTVTERKRANNAMSAGMGNQWLTLCLHMMLTLREVN